ncbi:YjzC family protein (plasmid) [Arthrobacter sp. Z1-9]
MVPSYKPGQDAPRSGQYVIVGPRGGVTGAERTSTRGNPLPPTPKPGQTYRLVDPTKNGAGKR